MIWIVEGETEGTTSCEFVGASHTEEGAFDIVADSSKREFYKTFYLQKYNLAKKTYVGDSQIIWPYAEYNHAQDGHLNAPENRNAEGRCKSMRMWGPHCTECAKKSVL